MFLHIVVANTETHFIYFLEVFFSLCKLGKLSSFLMIGYHIMCRSIFWWFQGPIFVYISFSNHVNIHRTHSKSLKHHLTSVVMVIAKCILSVVHVVMGHKVVAQREMHFSCVLGDLCCCVIKYSKCEIIVKVLSLFTSV